MEVLHCTTQRLTVNQTVAQVLEHFFFGFSVCNCSLLSHCTEQQYKSFLQTFKTTDVYTFRKSCFSVAKRQKKRLLGWFSKYKVYHVHKCLWIAGGHAGQGNW